MNHWAALNGRLVTHDYRPDNVPAIDCKETFYAGLSELVEPRRRYGFDKFDKEQ